MCPPAVPAPKFSAPRRCRGLLRVLSIGRGGGGALGSLGVALAPTYLRFFPRRRCGRRGCRGYRGYVQTTAFGRPSAFAKAGLLQIVSSKLPPSAFAKAAFANSWQGLRLAHKRCKAGGAKPAPAASAVRCGATGLRGCSLSAPLAVNAQLRLTSIARPMDAQCLILLRSACPA